MITQPELKVLNKNKLHVSRRPGCIAWLLLGLSAVLFVAIFSRLMNNIYVLIILLLGEVMFGLDNLGEWEDLILYKQENKAVFEKSVWSDKLCSGHCSESSSMKLTDIRQVELSANMNLLLLHGNGKIITLNMKGLMREEIWNLKKEINYFLNMSRLKYLDHTTVGPFDRLLLPSDSEEEYLQKLSKTYLPASNELTVSDNVLSSSKTCYRMQQNLSFPSLMCGTQPDSRQLANSRRGLYTENSTPPGRVTRDIHTLVSRNFLKFNRV